MTLDKVILALGYRGYGRISNFKYDALYVAFSRVRSSNDIRILIPKHNNWSSLSYIENLKPDPAISSYFHGYTGEGKMGEWSSGRALEHCQLKKDANASPARKFRRKTNIDSSGKW